MHIAVFSTRLGKALASAFVFLLGTSAVGFAQVTVTGTVTDETGLPLIGGGVVEQANPDNGVITDLDGHYSITVPDGNAVLVFSFIGYADELRTVGSQRVINVSLSPSSIMLDATVVTAMGISKSEKSLSYNVQQLELSEVPPIGSFVTALSGKVAGVTINSSSTGVGGASRVVMRGTKSISNNNNALYVVDGIPMQSLSGEQPEGVYAGAGQTGDGLGTINADDIESISVLSGPSAAALYGSAAANGVVIITTKKGAKDRVDVNYSNTTEFSRAYIMPNFQNTYGPSEEGSYLSWGSKLASASSYSPRDFFQTGVNEINNVSVSGGTERSQTYASLGATNARGIIRNNDVNKYNFYLRNTTDIIPEKLSLDVSATYSRVEEQNMVAQGEYANPIVPVYLFPAGDDFSKVQIYERYDASRNLKTQYWPYDFEHSMQNPYWVTDHQKFQNRKNRASGTAQLQYKPFKWLTLSARGKFDRTDETLERKYDAGTNTLFASKFGYYSKDDHYTEQRFAEVLATFNKYFGDNVVNLTGVVGANIDDVRYASDYVGGKLETYANVFTFANIDRTNSNTELKQTGWHSQNQSIFANVQTGYRSMLYLDLTGRVDWSSTLYTAGGIFYPTVGLSGIVTELVPAIKSSVFPYWKLRVSYSEVGNSPAASLYLLNPTYSLADGNASTSRRIANTGLVPERTKSYELGTDVHLFDSKLRLDATLYKSSTYNQFFNPSTSSTGGGTDIYINGGRVDNSGLEMTLHYSDEVGDFKWDTYLTYSSNKNKIIDLSFTNPVDGTVIDGNGLKLGGFGGVSTFLYEGGSISDLYVTTLETDENGYLAQTDKGNVIADYDEEDMVYAGSTDADFRLGWGGNLGWKRFSLGFLVNARFGGIVVSKTQAVMDYYGISKSSADLRDQGYVLINGMKYTDVQSYMQVLGANNGVMSQYVYDATNVRLSELSLGYNVPIPKKLTWLKGLNVSVVAHNLLMLYMNAPFDPEVTASTGTYNQGVDYFMQPSTRSLGFSVKLKL